MAADASGLRQAVQEWAERALERAVEDMAAEMDRNCPVDLEQGGSFDTPGHLKDTQRVEVRGLEGSIAYTAEYASFVDEGTPPHVIEGNPHLAFFWPKVNAFVVLPRVNHPGTQAQPWFSDVFNDDAFGTFLNAAGEWADFR